MHACCFAVEVAGTTGAGDCTIGGFLAGLLRGLAPEAVMTAAVGTGACCVEKPDATSGVVQWQALQNRIDGGWARRPAEMTLPGWRRDGDRQVSSGPQDIRFRRT